MMHPDEERLILHFYDEGTDRRAIADHLRSCDRCGRRYAELTRTLTTIEPPVVPRRDEHYPERVWHSVEARLALRETSRHRVWFSLPRPALVGAVAALLILAFFLGRWSDRPSGQPISPEARDRVLLVTVGDHLERSQRLLIELVNAGDPTGTDLSSQQASARSLALNNRLYRHTAGRAGKDDLVLLLEELETLLLELANGPSQPAYAELTALQRRITARGLIMRIHLLEERARIDAGRPVRQSADAAAAELKL